MLTSDLGWRSRRVLRRANLRRRQFLNAAVHAHPGRGSREYSHAIGIRYKDFTLGIVTDGMARYQYWSGSTHCTTRTELSNTTRTELLDVAPSKPETNPRQSESEQEAKRRNSGRCLTCALDRPGIRVGAAQLLLQEAPTVCAAA